jgi:hypothetical protein
MFAIMAFMEAKNENSAEEVDVRFRDSEPSP